jgi:hypothetical protein
VNDSIFLELNDEMKEIDKEKASPACWGIGVPKPPTQQKLMGYVKKTFDTNLHDNRSPLSFG